MFFTGICEIMSYTILNLNHVFKFLCLFWSGWRFSTIPFERFCYTAEKADPAATRTRALSVSYFFLIRFTTITAATIMATIAKITM
jgi:hypothetical protein